MTYEIQIGTQPVDDPAAGKTTDGVEPVEGAGISRVVVTDADKAAPKDEPEKFQLQKRFVTSEEEQAALANADPHVLRILGRQAKSYGELQHKMSSTRPGVEIDVEDGTPAKKAAAGSNLIIDTDEGGTDEEGVDLEALEAVFAEHGKLREEDYAKLEKQGISKGTVDSYVRGQVALGNQMRADLVSEVGSEENLETLLTWAKTNVDQSTIDAFNDAIVAKDIGRAKFAIGGLLHLHQQKFGVTSQLIEGDRTTGGGGDVLANMEQLIVAQSDPRYKRDEAYRKQVVEKAKRSTALMGT